ncbi:MAG: adenylosuccinate lyase [Cyanobacteria bacterium]|nr:adenylosuccinate lyase [Cyanobacteriota bacterium]MDA1021312.1 adenylosuccinate lyase [Cyanobacteriota bacterium]
MIDIYTRAEMQLIWADDNVYQKWLDVEIAVCGAYRQIGRIPRSSFLSIQDNARFDLTKIKELQERGQQDITAFLNSVSDSLSEDEAAYLHLGLSASDLKDTALSLTIKESAQLLDQDMYEFMEALKELAISYKNTVCIGRVNGTYSEPISFGLKMLGYYDDIRRARHYLKNLVNEVCVAMFSGATGTFVNLDTEIETLAAANLGLKPALVSTQVIGRDRLAMFVNQLAVIASIVERLAIEIRNLQRPEIRELEEPFLLKMAANNVLPHQRSPWRSENVCGLARVLRSYTTVGLENIALWHERDSTHNASERIILPDACKLLDFIFYRMTQTMKGLVINPKRMYQNLNMNGGIVFANQITLRLVAKSMDRQMAKELIDGYAQEAWANDDGDFKKLVMNCEQIRKIFNEDEIETCFKADYYLQNIDKIYAKIFSDNEEKKNLEVPSYA